MSNWIVAQLECFSGGPATFARDAGLFCRAFNEIGEVGTKLILKAPHKDGEITDLVIRATDEELSSVEWWKSIKEPYVFVYPQHYTNNVCIMEAMKNAGKKIVVYMDMGSEIYPINSWWFKTKLIFRKNKIQGGKFFIFRSLIEIVKAHLGFFFSFKRKRFFRTMDYLVLPSEMVKRRLIKIPFYLPKSLKPNALALACPINWTFRYDGSEKKNMVVAVGRWDDEESKRTTYLIDVIKKALSITDAEYHIFGTTPQFVYDWYDRLNDDCKKRVFLHGRVANDELRGFYNSARVVLCTSIHEGTHLASAEGLCFGCSVVVAPCPTLSCIHWYTSHNSGTICEKDNTSSFANALKGELDMWERGERDAKEISDYWCDRLHVTNSARKIIDVVSSKRR